MRAEDHISAHAHSIYNRSQIMASRICGCFYCLKIFESNEIVDWTDADDDTALCPSCEIDSVIGDASGYPITREFLLKMQEYWF